MAFLLQAFLPIIPAGLEDVLRTDGLAASNFERVADLNPHLRGCWNRSGNNCKLSITVPFASIVIVINLLFIILKGVGSVE